jgi:hypothetical protein
VSAQARQIALTVRDEQQAALPEGERREALPPPSDMTGRQKAAFMARQNLDKTTDQIRGWLSEAS